MKDLTEILAISGKGGLFKIVAQSKNSVIVESLQDGKRIPVHASQAISSLEEISIFTTGEDLLLKDVFKRIFEHTEGQKAPSHKASDAELQAFMEKVVPEYDKDQVYVSDIKKVMKWYNHLYDADMLDFVHAEEEKDDESKDGSKDKNAEGEQSDEK